MFPVLLILIALICSSGSPAWADKFNFTSYYPAPKGSYYKITLNPQAALRNTLCDLGTFYSNSSDNSNIYFCGKDPLTLLPNYTLFPGIWSLNGNYLTLTDTTNPSAKLVGIGTQSPVFKLTLDNDGGIISDDLTGIFSDLPDLGAGTRLVWYPKKGAFRAGYVSGTEWNDIFIGNNTTAMGAQNSAQANASIIWGGQGNSTMIPTVPSDPPASVIIGGSTNSTHGNLDQILGGSGNTAQENSRVFGQSNFSSSNSTIGGGRENSIPLNNSYSVIAGGYGNNISASYATISGGGKDQAGGVFDFNSIGANSNDSVVSGGTTNNITSNSQSGVISGGRQNTITGNYSTIGGGSSNLLSGNYSTIAGGVANTIPNGDYSVISGGHSNGIVSFYGSIAGGEGNYIEDSAMGAITGGRNNIIIGQNSIVIGGEENSVTGANSLAAGKSMSISGNHSFLWGYSSSALASPLTASDAFIIYSGSMGIRDISPGAKLEINGNSTTDDYLAVTSTTASPPGNIFIIKSGSNRVGVNNNNPLYPMQFGTNTTNGNGANVDAAGNFNSTSTRISKENIKDLSLKDSLNAFYHLVPVRFHYKKDNDEEYLGFIAEDAPDIVAENSRQGMAPAGILAVLTKVIQHQQEILEHQNQETKILQKEISQLKKRLDQKQ